MITVVYVMRKQKIIIYAKTKTQKYTKMSGLYRKCYNRGDNDEMDEKEIEEEIITQNW